MTSRPSVGVQQRPPQQQHMLSTPNLSQRQAAQHHQQQQQQQRASSQQHQQPLPLPQQHQQPQQQQPQQQQLQQQQQQYPPPSPVRKDPALYDYSPVDPGSDGPPPARLGQRRAGSRLKLELSQDSADSILQGPISDSPGGPESAKAFTPSRIMAPTDSSDLGDMSPRFPAHPLSVEMDMPLPMPRRPPPFVTSAPRRDMPPPPASTNPAKKDTRPKPYTVEPPAAAPRYSAHADAAQKRPGGPGGPAAAASTTMSGYADFFPWTGHHPEDQFSDSVIRQGYYDKGLFSTAETQSAKGTLFTALKHKTGLTALSSIFTAVLGQRRFHGQITAPSTFKPPPRVTLTDTKREAWLRDLANPSISLRRLSRTIPHGIRGKVLLDQCLNKQVPTDRAIWLIKCVGANELRATKRKGVSTLVMGGEARWIKDWTVSVEQFVENVYFAFDEDDWRSKINYTTRLAAHLFSEYLLDREHYSDWLVSNLENSPESRLPMWILITRLYWANLLKLRKYGRRLVTALISHLHLIYNHPDRDLLQPLLQDLSQCLNSLILRSPENFVSPSTWAKYRDALKACLPAGDEARHSAFAAINTRNEHLAASANRSQPAARHILVRMLDGTLQAPLPAELPAQCWGISKDKDALAKALLEWCTSLYRPGQAKVYVTSRILQHWSTLGLDPTVAVLDFLDADACEEQERKDTLYHVVCELVRAGIFSVPRYVQWLIARGGLRNPEDVLPDGPAPTRLLAEIPVHTLTSSQRNLRGGTLRRASFSVIDEAQNVEFAIKRMKQTLGMPMEPPDPILTQKPFSLAKLSRRIASADRALKAEIGCWLRASFAAHAEEKDKGGGQAPDISPAVFYAARSLLEAAGDFFMLGEILKTLTSHSSIEILAAIADTVNRHFFIFSALGDALPLFRSLHQRLKAAACEQGIALRPLLASLVSLAPRVPGMEELASQLKKDLALTDRQNPVDVCSPVSDNMVARLQDEAGDLHEEIEKLLAGGSSLDRGSMERLFQTVVQRLQACWDKAADEQRAYSSLLGRLRLFNAQHFDGLMVKWLLCLRTLSNRPSILRIFPLLVSVGCLDMCAILATASELPGAAGQGASVARTPTTAAATPQVVQITYRTRYMQEVLQLLTAPIWQDDLLTADEVYCFSILQDQAIRECPKEVLSLIFLASAEYSYARGQNDVEGLPLEADVVQQSLLELLKRLVLRDATGVARALGVKSANSHAGGWIDSLTTKLLIPTATNQTHVSFDQVLELTNEFTLPFCQVKLALSLSMNEQTSQEAADRQQSHVELFANAMDKAIGAGNISWVGMLSCLSPEITQHLKVRAQNHFLEVLPSVRNPPPADPAALAHSVQTAENLLSVIDAIMRGSPAVVRQSQLPPSVVDKLVDLWELLATSGPPTNPNPINPYDPDAMVTDDPPPPPSPKPSVLTHWLPLLLNLVTLHAHSFDPSKATSDVRAKMLVACAGLLQELDAPIVLPPCTSITSGNPNGGNINASAVGGGCGIADTAPLSRRVFDLSCLLADNLPEDARGMCVRAVRECAGGDARVRYLFSFGQTHGGGAADAVAGGALMLAQRDRLSQPPRGGSTPGGSASGSAASGGGTATTLFSVLLGTPAAMWGVDQRGGQQERLSVFRLRRWEALSEPTPNVGENDTALGLGLFEARRV
ncbi:hypothetical protein C8A05DRAFT_16893 [Staphylotrichum tortipilum]|uniref:Mediator of RNA polymerase II transcription subunit 12 n=1 Tax=Staphylotrichum tortipilum TaxID=2831512 RepID=A0AAN6RRL0_9PEZI|nr:hypothetical protein C8A05DRAFT_16893 [Staphylotrichum longicolle]